jgi:putative phosphoesterase
MLVGIISDSHDDMDSIKKAVELFNGRGVSQVLHAGDLISPFTFEVLGDLMCPFAGIFGNNDGDKLLLNEKSGGRLKNQPFTTTVDGRKAVLVHEPSSVEALAASGLYEIVIYGHTHTPEERMVGDTLVINPGKAARLHKGRSTVALLETEDMRVEVIDLQAEPRRASVS